MIAMMLMLAAPVATAAPPAPPRPPVAVAPPRGAAAMKARGMSEAGIAILRKQSVPDPDARAAQARRQALRAQLSAAADAAPFDLDAFSALLKESSQLENNARSRNEERILATLRALPAEDRPIFASAVFGDGGEPPQPRPAP